MTPMSNDQHDNSNSPDENKLIAERRGKLSVLRAAGDAYPNDFRRNSVAEELHLAQERLLHAEKDGIKEAYLAGVISEKVMKKLLSQVDERLFSLERPTKKRNASTDPKERV